QGGRGPRGGAPQQAAPAPAFSGPALNLRSPAHRTERELLKLALQKPALVSPAFDAYGVDEFTAPPYAAVRQCIEEAGGAEQGVVDDRAYLGAVLDAAPDNTVRNLVTELAVEVFHGKSIDETYAGMHLVHVRLRAVDRRIADVQSSLARLGTNVAPQDLAAAQNEVWVLQQYAQTLRAHGAAAL
ncbi:DNA primase, partial [Streptomyces sp. SID8016]|nr:DNA primase [Streptomyces sp. SID8016]